MMNENTPDVSSASPKPLRVLLAGFLMGLANLVPGVSGGTMILAMGLYERFIGVLADLSRMRLSRDRILFVGLIGVGAVAALGGLSGLAVTLVSESRWIMYSLFIGMTLGGAPDLLKKCNSLQAGPIASFVATFALMAALAWGMAGTQVPENTLVLILMGMLGASSMILPGISGSYMLLLFGMYDVVVGSLSVGAFLEDPMSSLRVIAPVGVGVVLGIGLLSNLLKTWLAKKPAASHAALMGLLLGSVLGLYPFREPVNAELSNKPFRKSVSLLLAGTGFDEVNEKYGMGFSKESAAQVRLKYTGKSGGELKQLGDELKPFDPTGSQIGISLALLAMGFAFTRSLGRRSAGQKAGKES